MPLKVLLADDHTLFLEGIQNLLVARNVQVVGTARDGLEALEKARTLQPNVILMDIRMPRCDGLMATRLIKAELPDIKIVMLTTSAEEKDLFEAIKSGASGYMLKNIDGTRFIEYLTAIGEGEVRIEPSLATKLLQEFARKAEGAGRQAAPDDSKDLTSRQKEVLVLVAQGLTYKEVGVALGLAEATVKYHMADILQRLHLNNRKQAVAYSVRMGLVKDRRIDKL